MWGYIANNTEKQTQLKHDDVTKAFSKIMNNALDKKTIENVAPRTNIRLLYNIKKARNLAVKRKCVKFRVFDCLMAPADKQVESVAAKNSDSRKRWLKLKCESSITLSTSCSPMASACCSTASLKCMKLL